MRKVYQLLLVCTGNLCRSSMAEALAKKLLKERFKAIATRVKVDSAGVSAIPGLPATAGAVRYLKSRGIDLSQHRSKVFTPALACKADLILTMTVEQRERIIQMLPSEEDKTFVLKEFTSLLSELNSRYNSISFSSLIQQVAQRRKKPNYYSDFEWDISDPTGKSEQDFEFCAQELENELSKIFELIELEAKSDLNGGELDENNYWL